MCFVCLFPGLVCLLPREQSWQELSPVRFLLHLILRAFTGSGRSSLDQVRLGGFYVRVPSRWTCRFEAVRVRIGGPWSDRLGLLDRLVGCIWRSVMWRWFGCCWCSKEEFLHLTLCSFERIVFFAVVVIPLKTFCNCALRVLVIFDPVRLSSIHRRWRLDQVRSWVPSTEGGLTHHHWLETSPATGLMLVVVHAVADAVAVVRPVAALFPSH